jgi:hypothetical protein
MLYAGTTQAPKFICLRRTLSPVANPKYLKLGEFETVSGDSESGLGKIPTILRWTQPLKDHSVINVELRHRHDGVSAIEGLFQALAGAGIIGGDDIAVGNIEKGVEMNHVARHVVGPLKDLGANIDKEGIRGPPTEDHDLRGGVIHEEESHCGSRSNGAITNFARVETKSFESSVQGASVTKQFSDEGVGYGKDLIIYKNRAQGGVLIPVGDI